MNANTIPVIIAALLALHAPAANAQYTPRPGAPGGMQAAVERMRDEDSSSLGPGFVTHLRGEAFLRSADDEDWVALSQHLPLRSGDRLWAEEDARIEVRFPLGATAWVSYLSELDIIALESGGRADAIQLALVTGEASFDVREFARPGSVFQVDLPNASIRAYEEARFRVNTLPDGTAQIGVINGWLVLETPDGLTDVSEGQLAEVQPDLEVFLDFLPYSDGWDDWVQSRAEIYERPAASVRYLPAALSPYAHEFDVSGRWVREPTHGFVWVPAVDRDWSPYSNGRWVWQGGDYVWLPDDPWYAPFHFGRWSWGASIGWFWIAPRGRAYWSPGYVGWSVVGDEVSWVPLGHDEVYYGYGNFGPRSVNVHQTTVVNVTNIYINSRVRNGVVVVRKDNFLRGKIRLGRIAPSRNPFEGHGGGGSQVIGRPPVLEVKPLRETRQPRGDGQLKRRSLPPARLEKESGNIRERVVAPSKEKSAFRKGGAPRPLQNVRKEKELEKWTPPRKKPVSRPGVAPSSGERERKGEVREKPGTQDDKGREGRRPSGKRRFKRSPEAGGEAETGPAQKVAPKEGRQGERNRQPAGKARD